MTDEWTRAEKRKAQSEQAKAIMDFVSMLSDKIADLEKENAELKEKLNFSTQYYQGEKAKDQLTKAKEIIRTFLNMPMPNNEEVFADVGIFLTKAEQFLKGEDIILEDAQAGNSPFDADEVFNKEMKTCPEEK